MTAEGPRFTLSDRLATARAEVESSTAALAAARAALDRARTLNADDKNVSDRVMQEAYWAVIKQQLIPALCALLNSRQRYYLGDHLG